MADESALEVCYRVARIYVVIHHDAGLEARLSGAIDLARALETPIVCLHFTQTPEPLRDFISPGGEAIAWQLEISEERRSAQLVRNRLNGEGVKWSWAEVWGTLSDALRRPRRPGDLFVLSTALPAGALPDLPKAISDHVLARGDLAVLMPPSAVGFEVRGPALVAWDGSAPAFATVRRSLPIIRCAESVVVFSVGEDGPNRPAEKLMRLLAREGVDAVHEDEPSGLLAPDFYIRERCKAGGFRYCVMGAFGHSRTLERWFGGVTQRMIERSEVPLLVSH